MALTRLRVAACGAQRRSGGAQRGKRGFAIPGRQQVPAVQAREETQHSTKREGERETLIGLRNSIKAKLWVCHDITMIGLKQN